MTVQNNPKSDVPVDPRPLEPRGGSVVDVEVLTLRWEPVEGTDAQRLEVAAASDFETLVVEEDVEGDACDLGGRFEADDHTYYWRVLARDERGWSRGERVQSFVAGTAEERAAVQDTKTERPDEDEELGPYPELVGSAGAEAVAEMTGRERAKLDEELRQGVAQEGVEAGQIIGIAASILLVITIIAVLLSMWIFNVSRFTRFAVADEARYIERVEAEQEAAQLLDQYSVVDEEAGIYRVPIDQVMSRMLNQAYEQRGEGATGRLPLPVSVAQGDVVPTESGPASDGEASAPAGSSQAGTQHP